jgi:hypothetical protein
VETLVIIRGGGRLGVLEHRGWRTLSSDNQAISTCAMPPCPSAFTMPSAGHRLGVIQLNV